MAGLRTISAIGGVALFGLASLGSAYGALLKYEYVGPEFDTFTGDSDWLNTFHPGDRVSGWFVIDCGMIPLGKGRCSSLPETGEDYAYAVSEGEFSAGWLNQGTDNYVLTDPDDWRVDRGSSFTLSFSTSADSSITDWMVRTSRWRYRSSDAISMSTFMDEVDSRTDYGFIVGDTGATAPGPGAWTVQTVPIPGALYMLPSGLAMLVVPYWLRRFSNRSKGRGR